MTSPKGPEGGRRAEGQKTPDSSCAIDPLLEEKARRLDEVCHHSSVSRNFLENEVCKVVNREVTGWRDRSLKECKEKDTEWYFFETTKGLYNPMHPESVIGESLTRAEIDRYVAFKTAQIEAYNREHPDAKRRLEFGIKEMGKFLGKNVGKVGIWQLDQTGFRRLLSVAKFFENAVESACDTAGLETDQCVLYHIISFENSGSLWAGSLSENPAALAAGPAQVMSGWYNPDWYRGLGDGLTTTNFFRVVTPYFVKVGKKTVKRNYYHYDGRFDPIANLEFGARTMRDGISDFGSNHPDFAVLAHNQGPVAETVLKEWASKHLSVSFDAYKDIYKKQSAPKPRRMAAFLDYLATKRNGKAVTVAEILLDTALTDKYFTTDNGGKGYISKILAMNELSQNPSAYGIQPEDDSGAFPAKLNTKWEVKYKWEELFHAGNLPVGTNLRDYAVKNRLDLGMLAFLNQQIRDPDYAFDRNVRLWLPNKNTPKEYVAEYSRRGAGVLSYLLKMKQDYLNTLTAPKADKDRAPVQPKSQPKSKTSVKQSIPAGKKGKNSERSAVKGAKKSSRKSGRTRRR